MNGALNQLAFFSQFTRRQLEETERRRGQRGHGKKGDGNGGGGVTALHSVHSHVFRGMAIVAGSNLARSHGCVRALMCHSRMSSLWGARKNFAFRVHHLDHGTTQSGAGEEKHSCFSAEVPQDVFIMKPPPPPIHQ